MEDYIIEKDIPVFCITSKSFPEGVYEAHRKLHALFPPAIGRNYFGISFADVKGSILYKAAVQLPDMNKHLNSGTETFTIRKGLYSGVVIENFMRDIPAIGRTFNELLADSRLDPNGYCLEMYYNETDVRCLVKLLDT